jgi:peptidoglycan hydrolase-like protein with peptidoglycan-binding domain
MKSLILFAALLGTPILLAAPVQSQTTSNLLKAPVVWPTIRAQSYELKIGAVQYLLRGRGFYKSKIDGIYGAKTIAAVKSFQKSRGLKADGILGPKTLPLLVTTVKRGSRGDAVRAAQLLARVATGHEGQQPYAALEIDGIFGVQTEKAVKWAQATQNQFEDLLKEDGIVGARTWSLLLGGRIVGSQM